MFDISWSEMAVIAVVALIVLGPKEIPNALKTAAHWMRTARKLAREFQSGVDQIVREAELDEARKTVTQAGGLNLGKEIEKVVDPTGETRRQFNTDPTKAAAPVKPAIAAPAATPAPSPTPSVPSPPGPAAAAQTVTPPAPAQDAGGGNGADHTAPAAPEPAAVGDRRA